MIHINIDSKKTGAEIRPELHGQFIEFLGSGIYDGIWVGEESDIPNYNGLRKDVVDAMKELKPPVLRWPGGCFADVYHWRDGVGPREQRPTYFNENFGTMEVENNSFGTHEFMMLCEIVGAKPWFNINMMTGTTAETREWVEYVNRETSTSLGKERAVNGHADPYGVELWGIGNESWAGGGTYTAEAYANEYRKHTSAIPSFGAGLPWVDTNKEMRMIAVGPDGNKPKERVAWTKDFFAELGKYRKPRINGYDLHFYNWNLGDETDTVTSFSTDAWYKVINGAFELEDVIHEQYALIQSGVAQIPKEEGAFATEINVDLIVGEWGNWHNIDFTAPSILWQQCTMRDAITTALTLDIFHRNADKVKMACVAQSVNVLNSLFLTKADKTVLTPNYYVFQLYKKHQGAEIIEISDDSPRLERVNEPDLKHVYSFGSIKEDVITMNIVNTSVDKKESITLTFDRPVAMLKGEELVSDSIYSFNDFGENEQVTIKNTPIDNKEKQTFTITSKQASIAVYQFKVLHEEA
ncbi:alpha-L-arabinofuranosidase C-terminal domain-containing protein [Enterococcus sp.]|uniref:alpha-N-arabinofuranosidase n=1 Tax=Enterococcus sp. TaxID=35783 RepID=UPI002897FDF1|nr:alpha-L-arabinofuranosidase C-terminal domain-containing protein [Enterococcus sp.]